MGRVAQYAKRRYADGGSAQNDCKAEDMCCEYDAERGAEGGGTVDCGYLCAPHTNMHHTRDRHP